MRLQAALVLGLCLAANASVKSELDLVFAKDAGLTAALEKLNANLLHQSERCRDEPVIILSPTGEVCTHLMWNYAKATGIQSAVLDLREFDARSPGEAWSQYAANFSLFGEKFHLAILLPDPRKNIDAVRFWRTSLTHRREFYFKDRHYPIQNVDYVLFIPLELGGKAGVPESQPEIADLVAAGLPPEISGLFENRFHYTSDAAIFRSPVECASELTLNPRTDQGGEDSSIRRMVSVTSISDSERTALLNSRTP